MWNLAVISSIFLCSSVSSLETQKTGLDHLKADILKYVLEEHEDNPEDAEKAIDVLQFILGTRIVGMLKLWLTSH